MKNLLNKIMATKLVVALKRLLGCFEIKRIDSKHYEKYPYHFELMKHPQEGDIGIKTTSIKNNLDVDISAIPDLIKNKGGQIIHWDWSFGLFTIKEDRLTFIKNILPDLILISKSA